MLHDFTNHRFDIIVQAGQSNSEGAGFGSVDEPYTPDGRVWYLNRNGTITQAAEEVWGNDVRSNFSLPFARAYIRAGMLAEGRELLILRTAVGEHYYKVLESSKYLVYTIGLMGVASFGNLWLNGAVKYLFLLAVLALACWLYRGELKVLFTTALQIVQAILEKLKKR